MRTETRPRHATAAVRRRDPARQDRRRPRPRPGRDPEAEPRAAALDDGELAAGRIDGPRSASTRSSQRSDWYNKFRKLPYGKGVGIACGSYLSGAGLPIYWNDMPHSGVQIKLDRSGGVAVFCGATDIGQGSDSVLAFIVADVLGIDPVDIRVVCGDTDLTPVDLGSYSSRVTLMMGNAAIEAAERARAPLAEAVSKKLSIPRSRLVFGGSRVFDAENPETGVTFAEAVQFAETAIGTIGSTGSYKPPRSPGRYKGAGVGPSPAYSYSAAIAEVDVDPETGLVAVSGSTSPTTSDGRSTDARDGPGRARSTGLGEAPGERWSTAATARRRAQVPVDARIQESDDDGDVRRRHRLIEDPDPNGPGAGAKRFPGTTAADHALPSRTRCSMQSVARVDAVPISAEKVLKASERRRTGRKAASDRWTPPVEWHAPHCVPPPWEGGDGRATDDPKHMPVPSADPSGHRYKHDMDGA
ncbi:MAG: molybdopterin-dependent oxidoreductase [Blastocatellia bacterium]|nr:molybdopterin-dependent oxidoreductase [Blastocatellia bacterium]